MNNLAVNLESQSDKLSDSLINSPNKEFAIGKDAEFSLRVSAACLTLFRLKSLDTEQEMVVLERVVKINEEGVATHQLQPIGGAIAILDPALLSNITDGFKFDSKASQISSDLRIYIKPENWNQLAVVLDQEFSRNNSALIETSPYREIEEEIAELLDIKISKDQFKIARICTSVQTATASARSNSDETVRIFAIDQVEVLDHALVKAITDGASKMTLEQQVSLTKNSTDKKSSWIELLPLESVVSAINAADPNSRHKTVACGDRILANNVYHIVSQL